MGKLKTENKKLKKEIAKLKLDLSNALIIKNSNHNNINNNNNNKINITNNINIISFGNEDYDKYKNELMPLIRDFTTPEKMLLKMHFNPDIPEYNNIFLPEMNSKCVKIFKDGKLEDLDVNIALNLILKKQKQSIDRFIDYIESKITPKQYDTLLEYVLSCNNFLKKVDKSKLKCEGLEHYNMFKKKYEKMKRILFDKKQITIH
jgi:hypothetical protein